MILINEIEVGNFKGAFRGLRNPLNSWHLSDSYTDENGSYILGEKDLDLAKRMIKGGPDESKFLRQIFVSMDITAPLYWWKEMDTYKVATVANSTSTMHKLTSKPIEASDFSFDSDEIFIGMEDKGDIKDYMRNAISACNHLLNRYNETKDKRYWRALVQLLPEGYNQTRTWTANYQVLRSIYFARRNHKLIEWHTFCETIENLPYAKELITIGG